MRAVLHLAGLYHVILDVHVRNPNQVGLRMWRHGLMIGLQDGTGTVLTTQHDFHDLAMSFVPANGYQNVPHARLYCRIRLQNRLARDLHSPSQMLRFVVPRYCTSWPPMLPVCD